MKKILIVDDDPDILFLLKRQAKLSHFECHTDNTGEECLQKAVHERPDLILLDMNLPKISGLGLIREIKKNPQLQNIPIIVLSGLQDEEIVRSALDLGASAYFPKKSNTNVEELFELIQRFL